MVKPQHALNDLETISFQIFDYDEIEVETIMWIKFAVLLVILTVPVYAKDTAPWFGSEASAAQRVDVIYQTHQPDPEISVDVATQCPANDCPAAVKIAK